MKRLITMTAILLLLPLAVQGSETEPHWTYSGPDGPEHWGELAEEFDICSRGRNQSPIDLVAVFDTQLPELHFEYQVSGRLVEINTGHAIQENVTPGNFVSLMDRRYELKQFHFHSPSEHTVNGQHYPMEVHLVHQNEAGELFVVGLFFEEGAHNDEMDQLPSFRAARGDHSQSAEFDYNNLVLERENYFYYNGSLTTPPCSEGVTWIVMQQPIMASPEQLQHFHDLLGFDNNRTLQPLNSRIVLE